MSLAAKMKREMSGKSSAVCFEKQLAALPAGDRLEVERFQALLRDHGAGMGTKEMVEKHGADYLGFTPAEVAIINGAQAPKSQ
ncbi:hypothetical protein ABIC83_002465 [Roseateles asaccharophilus]|uniref:hypothetical protein n=1 Tax=Roseateles asaccharophilus TaxID=582607 RepID=UPI0038350212